jgi:hypothetical protein
VENKLTPKDPHYARWSWSARLAPHCSCINVDDCSSQEEDDGFKRSYWYLGEGLMERIATMIQVVKDAVSPTHLIFCGNSMGGFASLSMMRYFPDAFSVVCNTQTNLYYYWSAHVKNLEAFLKRKFTPDETNVALNLTRDARILYLQCLNDQHHIENHYRRFQDLTVDFPHIRYELFYNEKGHNYGYNFPEFQTLLEKEFDIHFSR